MTEGRKLFKIRPEEAALILTIRRLEQGELKIEVTDKVPTLGYQVEKRIQFKRLAENEGLTGGDLFGEIEKPIKKVV
jgi:hypothetical protein